jgi:hypothetical protein
VDVTAEALRVVERARSSGEGPRVELTGLRPGEALDVLGSRAMLGRALEILVGRAIAGTPVDRSVTVRADCQGNAAILEVGSDGGRAPRGWSIRAATAVRIVESHMGRATLDLDAPSALVSLPLAPG